MIGLATVLILIGGGMYLNRYVSRWRFRDDPGIMRFVQPMSSIGLILLVAGTALLVVGVGLTFL